MIYHKAKTIDKDKWIFGYFVEIEDKHLIIYETDKKQVVEMEVQKDSVNEFTGMYSSDNEMIFKHDILEFEDLIQVDDEFTDNIQNRAEVIFKDGMYTLSNFDIDADEGSWTATYIKYKEKSPVEIMNKAKFIKNAYDL